MPTMRRSLAILALLAACTVETSDDAPSGNGAVTASGPYQLTCEDLVECLESDRPTCSLSGQLALGDASDAIDYCEYARDSGQDAFNSCTDWQCE